MIRKQDDDSACKMPRKPAGSTANVQGDLLTVLCLIPIWEMGPTYLTWQREGGGGLGAKPPPSVIIIP